MLTNAVAPDKLGGLERIVRELASELVQRGSRVTVLAKRVNEADPPSEIGEDGVIVERYRLANRSSRLFAPTYPLHTARAVRSSVRRADAAVLHAHFPVPAVPLALTRKPYLYSFHAPVYRELLLERHTRYPLARPLQPVAVEGLRRAERLVVRRAARIIVLSEYARSELHLLDPRAAERATLIAGGIDTDRFNPGPGRRDAWSAEAEPLIFTARRLTPRTGVLELLSAMPTILRSSAARATCDCGYREFGDFAARAGQRGWARRQRPLRREDQRCRSRQLLSHRRSCRDTESGPRGIRPHDRRSARLRDTCRRHPDRCDAGAARRHRPGARGGRCDSGRHRGCCRRRPQRLRARRRIRRKLGESRRRRALMAERRTPLPRGIQAILGSPCTPLMPIILVARRAEAAAIA